MAWKDLAYGEHREVINSQRMHVDKTYIRRMARRARHYLTRGGFTGGK
jgi:hypothetical protein